MDAFELLIMAAKTDSNRRANGSLLDTLAEQASMQSLTTGGTAPAASCSSVEGIGGGGGRMPNMPMMDYRQYLPPFTSQEAEKRPRAMSEPWKTDSSWQHSLRIGKIGTRQQTRRQQQSNASSGGVVLGTSTGIGTVVAKVSGVRAVPEEETEGDEEGDGGEGEDEEQDGAFDGQGEAAMRRDAAVAGASELAQVRRARMDSLTTQESTTYASEDGFSYSAYQQAGGQGDYRGFGGVIGPGGVLNKAGRSPSEATILESAITVTDVLETYAAIYNKNGRIGIYTREERDAIIRKFQDKRRRRVWKKKIRYTCRKNLADRRVRVKGRFVKAAESSSILDPSSNTGDTTAAAGRAAAKVGAGHSAGGGVRGAVISGTSSMIVGSAAIDKGYIAPRSVGGMGSARDNTLTNGNGGDADGADGSRRSDQAAAGVRIEEDSDSAVQDEAALLAINAVIGLRNAKGGLVSPAETPQTQQRLGFPSEGVRGSDGGCYRGGNGSWDGGENGMSLSLTPPRGNDSNGRDASISEGGAGTGVQGAEEQGARSPIPKLSKQHSYEHGKKNQYPASDAAAHVKVNSSSSSSSSNGSTYSGNGASSSDSSGSDSSGGSGSKGGSARKPHSFVDYGTYRSDSGDDFGRVNGDGEVDGSVIGDVERKGSEARGGVKVASSRFKFSESIFDSSVDVFERAIQLHLKQNGGISTAEGSGGGRGGGGGGGGGGDEEDQRLKLEPYARDRAAAVSAAAAAAKCLEVDNIEDGVSKGAAISREGDAGSDEISLPSAGSKRTRRHSIAY